LGTDELLKRSEEKKEYTMYYPVDTDSKKMRCVTCALLAFAFDNEGVIRKKRGKKEGRTAMVPPS
jgi:hypothetical protein